MPSFLYLIKACANKPFCVSLPLGIGYFYFERPGLAGNDVGFLAFRVS
jgi:hypothetical protein